MFVVIFEVRPKKERWEEYLAFAKFLRPKLEATDGFIENERFGSKRIEGLLLSLSAWRDEKSVIRWRTQGEHHGVQEKGRSDIFEDYHLRVGEVTDDSDPPRGHPVQQQRFDQTETGAAKMVTITELSGVPFEIGAPGDFPTGLIDHDWFESITNPGKFLLLASWRDAAAAIWIPAATGPLRHRRARIIRDYGMFDRREAPQYYPPAKRP